MKVYLAWVVIPRDGHPMELLGIADSERKASDIIRKNKHKWHEECEFIVTKRTVQTCTGPISETQVLWKGKKYELVTTEHRTCASCAFQKEDCPVALSSDSAFHCIKGGITNRVWRAVC